MVDASKAAQKGAPAVHDIAPDNNCYNWALGDKAAVDAAFAKAAHVTKLELVNNRLIPNAIEPRAANATYSRADDSYTLYVASQNPHVERLLMTAFVLGPARAQGARGGARRRRRLRLQDLPLRRGRRGHLGVASSSNRPVKWTAERSESFVSDAHGRDHHTAAELAMDKDGKFLAMRVTPRPTWAPTCRLSPPRVPTILYAHAARRPVHDAGDLRAR